MMQRRWTRLLNSIASPKPFSLGTSRSTPAAAFVPTGHRHANATCRQGSGADTVKDAAVPCADRTNAGSRTAIYGFLIPKHGIMAASAGISKAWKLYRFPFPRLGRRLASDTQRNVISSLATDSFGHSLFKV